MKKIYTLLFFIFIGAAAFAQPDEKKAKEIESLKVAFISKELDLSTDEAQKFWPVYNQYNKEMKAAKKEDLDVLDRDEKVLNIRKKYKDQFSKSISNDKINKLYGIESRFHQLLIKSMRKQQKLKDGNGEGPLRKKFKDKEN